MSDNNQYGYDDSYSTCVETYSTLRVFSDTVSPDEITTLLRVEPTTAFRMGESHAGGRLKRKENGWFYCTKDMCDSRDTRLHIDLILAAFEGRKDAVEQLRIHGCEIDITSYWVSSGQGGPWLMPQQMLKLGDLGIGVWWDVYFPGESETDQRKLV